PRDAAAGGPSERDGATMKASEVQPAVAAATSIAAALDLSVEDATVLNDSNRLVLRLMPCDVVARVAPMAYQASAETAVELAQRLAETDSPVAALEPRAATSLRSSRTRTGSFSPTRCGA